MEREDTLPRAMDPNFTADGRVAPGGTLSKNNRKMTPAKITEDLLAKAWLNPEMHPTILRGAAECANCEIEEIPQEARESIAALSLWISSALAAGGSIEHLREFLDRLYPKPRRMEIDANVTARRAMISSSKNPEEAEALDAYYAMLNAPRGEEPIDVEYREVPDLSFLD